jgi:DNA-binding transcriptional LysR family regulator
MDRLHLMSVFVAVAQEQGFAAAARRLNLSAPAVTRAVASLEESLGVKLLNRTTRIVRVTEAGLRYLDDAQRIIAQVQAADAAAAGINSTPKGHLAVTAPVMFGRLFVMPGIVDYLQRYPDTQVDALFLDRVVNLLEEGLDVGIRIGELADSSMRALRVGQVRHIVCASPSYLQQNGIPQSPQDLMDHTIISSSAAQSLTDWRFNESSVRIQPRLTVTSNDAAIAAVKDGLGITRLLSYQVAESLAAGELKILLERFEPAPIPVSIVHRQGRFASAKVRAFIDLMAQRLRAHKALN